MTADILIPITGGRFDRKVAPPRYGPYIYSAYVIRADDEDRPMYIGMSCSPTSRLLIHERKRPWWPQSGCVELWLSSEESTAGAVDLERDLIQQLNPVHNVNRYDFHVGEGPRPVFTRGTGRYGAPRWNANRVTTSAT